MRVGDSRQLWGRGRDRPSGASCDVQARNVSWASPCALPSSRRGDARWPLTHGKGGFAHTVGATHAARLFSRRAEGPRGEGRRLAPHGGAGAQSPLLMKFLHEAGVGRQVGPRSPEALRRGLITEGSWGRAGPRGAAPAPPGTHEGSSAEAAGSGGEGHGPGDAPRAFRRHQSGLRRAHSGRTWDNS